MEFKNKFKYQILQRGRSYFLNDKIKSVQIKDDYASALIKGTKNYHVIVHVKNNQFIDGQCDCPYYQTGNYCKHIASLLYYLEEGMNDNMSNIKETLNYLTNDELKEFIYDNLSGDSDLLDNFRDRFM